MPTSRRVGRTGNASCAPRFPADPKSPETGFFSGFYALRLEPVPVSPSVNSVTFCYKSVVFEKNIAKLVPDLAKPVFYASGPEPLVESLDQTLKKLGVTRQRIKNDFLPGYQWP